MFASIFLNNLWHLDWFIHHHIPSAGHAVGALCLSNERVNRLKEASFPQRAGPDMNIQFSQEHQISWRTWRSGSGLRENFLSAGAIQTPTGSVAGRGAGFGVRRNERKWRGKRKEQSMCIARRKRATKHFYMEIIHRRMRIWVSCTHVDP